jgi:DNA polymerase-3 subunit beta
MNSTFFIGANVIKDVLNTVTTLSKDKNSILSNYLLSIKDSKLTVTASNEIVQTSMEIGVLNGDNCEILAKPDLFTRLKVLSGEIECKLKDDMLHIKNGNYKTTAKVFKNDGYPLESIEDYEVLGSFDSKDLIEFLKSSISTSSDEEQAREFTGVLMDIENGKANFVATNRARLLWVNKSIDNDAKFYAIIEKDGVEQVSRILKDYKDSTNVNVLYKADGDRIVKIAFQTDNIIVISKTIIGQFPQYQAVLLDNVTDIACVKFNRNELKESIQRVTAFATADLALQLTFKEDKTADLNLTNKEGETANDVVNFSVDDDKAFVPLTINVNWKYILDFLNNVKTDEVYLYYKEPVKPLELKAVNDENGIEYVYIMTPVR